MAEENKNNNFKDMVKASEKSIKSMIGAWKSAMNAYGSAMKFIKNLDNLIRSGLDNLGDLASSSLSDLLKSTGLSKDSVDFLTKYTDSIVNIAEEGMYDAYSMGASYAKSYVQDALKWLNNAANLKDDHVLEIVAFYVNTLKSDLKYNDSAVIEIIKEHDLLKTYKFIEGKIKFNYDPNSAKFKDEAIRLAGLGAYEVSLYIYSKLLKEYKIIESAYSKSTDENKLKFFTELKADFEDFSCILYKTLVTSCYDGMTLSVYLNKIALSFSNFPNITAKILGESDTVYNKKYMITDSDINKMAPTFMVYRSDDMSSSSERRELNKKTLINPRDIYIKQIYVSLKSKGLINAKLHARLKFQIASAQDRAMSALQNSFEDSLFAQARDDITDSIEGGLYNLVMKVENLMDRPSLVDPFKSAESISIGDLPSVGSSTSSGQSINPANGTSTTTSVAASSTVETPNTGIVGFEHLNHSKYRVVKYDTDASNLMYEMQKNLGRSFTFDNYFIYPVLQKDPVSNIVTTVVYIIFENSSVSPSLATLSEADRQVLLGNLFIYYIINEAFNNSANSNSGILSTAAMNAIKAMFLVDSAPVPTFTASSEAELLALSATVGNTVSYNGLIYRLVRLPASDIANWEVAENEYNPLYGSMFADSFTAYEDYVNDRNIYVLGNSAANNSSDAIPLDFDIDSDVEILRQLNTFINSNDSSANIRLLINDYFDINLTTLTRPTLDTIDLTGSVTNTLDIATYYGEFVFLFYDFYDKLIRTQVIYRDKNNLFSDFSDIKVPIYATRILAKMRIINNLTDKKPYNFVYNTKELVTTTGKLCNNIFYIEQVANTANSISLYIEETPTTLPNIKRVLLLNSVVIPDENIVELVEDTIKILNLTNGALVTDPLYGVGNNLIEIKYIDESEHYADSDSYFMMCSTVLGTMNPVTTVTPVVLAQNGIETVDVKFTISNVAQPASSLVRYIVDIEGIRTINIIDNIVTVRGLFPNLEYTLNITCIDKNMFYSKSTVFSFDYTTPKALMPIIALDDLTLISEKTSISYDFNSYTLPDGSLPRYNMRVNKVNYTVGLVPGLKQITGLLSRNHANGNGVPPKKGPLLKYECYETSEYPDYNDINVKYFNEIWGTVDGFTGVGNATTAIVSDNLVFSLGSSGSFDPLPYLLKGEMTGTVTPLFVLDDDYFIIKLKTNRTSPVIITLNIDGSPVVVCDIGTINNDYYTHKNPDKLTGTVYGIKITMHSVFTNCVFDDNLTIDWIYFGDSSYYGIVDLSGTDNDIEAAYKMENINSKKYYKLDYTSTYNKTDLAPLNRFTLSCRMKIEGIHSETTSLGVDEFVNVLTLKEGANFVKLGYKHLTSTTTSIFVLVYDGVSLIKLTKTFGQTLDIDIKTIKITYDGFYIKFAIAGIELEPVSFVNRLFTASTTLVIGKNDDMGIKGLLTDIYVFDYAVSLEEGKFLQTNTQGYYSCKVFIDDVNNMYDPSNYILIGASTLYSTLPVPIISEVDTVSTLVQTGGKPSLRVFVDYEYDESILDANLDFECTFVDGSFTKVYTFTAVTEFPFIWDISDVIIYPGTDYVLKVKATDSAVYYGDSTELVYNYTSDLLQMPKINTAIQYPIKDPSIIIVLSSQTDTEAFYNITWPSVEQPFGSDLMYQLSKEIDGRFDDSVETYENLYQNLSFPLSSKCRIRLRVKDNNNRYMSSIAISDYFNTPT